MGVEDDDETREGWLSDSSLESAFEVALLERLGDDADAADVEDEERDEEEVEEEEEAGAEVLSV